MAWKSQETHTEQAGGSIGIPLLLCFANIVLFTDKWFVATLC